MSSLDNLKTRLNFYGGKQMERMEHDKLTSLKRALNYSYQSETAILDCETETPRQFRCLINRNKQNTDFDTRSISIPFFDIQLNAPMIGKQSQGYVEVGLKPGDIFKWKQNNTMWLVFLQNLEESAYFRADIRRCQSKALVNDKKYWVYVRGPVQTELQYAQKEKIQRSLMNYTEIMFITKNEETVKFFHRFMNLKIEDETGAIKTWRVAAVDPYYGDGIIQVMLIQWYENTILDQQIQNQKAQQQPPQEIDKTKPYIEGPDTMDCYDRKKFKVHNLMGGAWYIIQNGIQRQVNQSSTEIWFESISGKPGAATIIYRTSDLRQAKKQVIIQAF